MSCEELRKDLPAYVRGEIEGEREQEITGHLAECPACKAEWVATKQVLDSIAAPHDGPVIEKCKEIITSAHRSRASDIHLLPQADEDVLRFRIDGVLHEQGRFTKPFGRALTARLKAMSEMDVAETRVAQDGRIMVKEGQVQLDLRVSAVPTVHGEKLTVRLLDPGAVLLSLDALGLSSEQLGAIREFLSLPSGMLVLTGPVGSGKTTLLYSMLAELDANELNITTVEDPVEYTLPGLAQTGVDPRAGFGFSRAIRHQLRSDPDVMMCGEIRDLETAEVLMQATLTGHLTLTTLHAATAPDVFRRLRDMGVEPFIIADALCLVCATRLVRVICEACREPYEPEDLEKAWLLSRGVDPTDLTVSRGKGCEKCRHTGYWGRTAVFEFLTVTDELRDLIVKQADADQIRETLSSAGHLSLVDDGIEKIRSGITTVAEVRRATKGL